MGNNKILRLAPYNPMLNPIEKVWSVVKASVQRLATSNEDLFNPQLGEISLREARLRILEKYMALLLS